MLQLRPSTAKYINTRFILKNPSHSLRVKRYCKQSCEMHFSGTAQKRKVSATISVSPPTPSGPGVWVLKSKTPAVTVSIPSKRLCRSPTSASFFSALSSALWRATWLCLASLWYSLSVTWDTGWGLCELCVRTNMDKKEKKTGMRVQGWEEEATLMGTPLSPPHCSRAIQEISRLTPLPRIIVT